MYIDDGGGGGSVDFGSIGDSMMSFKGAALSGGFAVSETGGKALLEAIRNMKDWVDENRVDLQLLKQDPQLGSSHGAHAMRGFIPQVAGDGQGFLTMLMKFRQSLDNAEEGIKTAMANYQAQEQRGTGKFKSA